MRRISGAGLVFALLCLPAATGGIAWAQTAGDGPPQFVMGSGRMVRGTITAVAPDRLSVKTQQGDSYTVVLTPNTQLRHGRDQVKVADVHVGDGVGAMGEVDPATKTVHALFVAVVSAEDLKKAREAMGKTFISGTVTAMNETKLTVMRSDGVSQVIEVDEDTSFKRGGRGMQMALTGEGAGPSMRQRADAPAMAGAPGGESITLADIKVGDLVAGPGKLKNGVFVPTELGVSDPTRQRRRGAGAGAGARETPPAGAPTTPPQELR